MVDLSPLRMTIIVTSFVKCRRRLAALNVVIPLLLQVLSVVSMVAVSQPNLVYAAGAASDQVQVLEGEVEDGEYGHADGYDGEVEVDFNDGIGVSLTKEKAERLATLEPRDALEFLFVEMNNAEEKVDLYTHVRFNFETPDRLENGQAFTLTPSFNGKSQLIINLRIRKDIANNSMVMLEALTQMYSMLSVYGSNLTISGTKSYSYFENEIIKHPVTGDFMAYHPTNGYHTIEHYHFHHQILAHMGVIPNQTTRAKGPLAWTELNLNAANGSKLAQRELAEIEFDNAKLARQGFSSFLYSKKMASDEQKLRREVLQIAEARGIALPEQLKAQDLVELYYDGRITQARNAMKSMAAPARAELKARTNASKRPEISNRKKELEALPKRLEAFVKINDRESVAQLLEAFVPWDEMEPMEVGMWRNWIKAIRKPNLNNRVLLFRGIDGDDPVQNSDEGFGEAKGYGFFSTLLTKNQGSYTRRLRSISTSRLKNGIPGADYDESKRSPIDAVPTIAYMMSKHSNSPDGSLFMSFSTDADVAYGFSGGIGKRGGSGGYLVAAIDRRRALSNAASNFKSEREILIPLIIFPDEVVHYEKYPGKSEGKQQPILADILARASAKYGNEVRGYTAEETTILFKNGNRLYSQAARWLKFGSCESSLTNR